MSGGNYILCDRAEHILYSQTHYPTATILATTPECVWECMQRVLPYTRLDDFYQPSDINQLAELTLLREYAWAKWMDEALFQIVPDFAQGFQPARAHLYFLKRTFDNFILPAKILQEFGNRAHPSTLALFERNAFIPNDLAPRPDDRPLFALLSPAILNGQVALDVLPDLPTVSERKVKQENRWQRALRNPQSIFNRVSLAFSRLLGNICSVESKLALNNYGQVYYAEVIPLLQKMGVAVHTMPRWVGNSNHFAKSVQEVKTILTQASPDILARTEFWQVTDPVSEGLRDFAKDYFESWITCTVPRSWGNFLRARQWLKDGNFSAVAGMEVQGLLAADVYLAAGSLGLPRIAAIHNPPGGAVDIPMQDLLGIIQSDIYIVNGQGDVDYFTQFQKRLGVFQRGHVVAVGSLRMERVRALAKQKKYVTRAQPVVMYVPTMLFGPYRFFAEGENSDVAYFELQRQLIAVFARFPNVRVLYKAFPGGHAWNPIEKLIAQTAPNVTVTHQRLTKLMWDVDAIVVDCTGSTAFAEVMLTNKPVLVYAGRDWAPLLPSAKQALSRRAKVADLPDTFVAMVENLLAAGDYTPCAAEASDEFLRLYVTHLNDGRSAERLGHILHQVIKQRAGCGD